MAANPDWWVFSEKMPLLVELIGGAAELAAQSGGSVTALALGPRAEAEQALARGAGRVLWLGELPAGALVDDVVPTLAALLDGHKPCGLLVGATRRGRAVAGRLAARLGLTALTDVLQLQYAADGLQARHRIFGGGALRVERTLSDLALATVGPGVFAARPAAGGGGGQVTPVDWVAPAWRATLVARSPRPAASVDLSAAKKVVCAGRGLARREDLRLVEELARLLGAELACTRPLAEGLDWLPRERYIGISGAAIKPELYLGVGVSGQVQHMIGMGGARVVVAINKDPQAPIFSQADYGIAGDLYTLVPALIQAIKNRSERVARREESG